MVVFKLTGTGIFFPRTYGKRYIQDMISGTTCYRYAAQFKI